MIPFFLLNFELRKQCLQHNYGQIQMNHDFNRFSKMKLSGSYDSRRYVS